MEPMILHEKRKYKWGKADDIYERHRGFALTDHTVDYSLASIDNMLYSS